MDLLKPLPDLEISTVKSIDSFDYNSGTSVTSAEEVLEESIRAIKVSAEGLVCYNLTASC